MSKNNHNNKKDKDKGPKRRVSNGSPIQLWKRNREEIEHKGSPSPSPVAKQSKAVNSKSAKKKIEFSNQGQKVSELQTNNNATMGKSTSDGVPNLRN